MASENSTACILCSINCGIRVELKNSQFVKIKGDRQHPGSKGYLCQKASRLNYYQHHAGRLSHPLKKARDGTHEEITWDEAISSIAGRLNKIKQQYGSHAVAYYGGGGQGNHLCQIYSSSLRAAIGTPYLYTALAQEKTGDFWVNGKLFGKQSCHITEDIEHSDYVIILGANPWQSHGFPRARQVLTELNKNPDRVLVVIDPRKTETAQIADFHLQVIPGTDAYLLIALLGFIIQENLQDQVFIRQHTTGFSEVEQIFQKVAVEEYAKKTGVKIDKIKDVARGFAKARNGCIRADLGIQQSLNSTLNSYLEKLLFLVTGNFAKKGSNNLHTQLVPIVSHSKEPEEGAIITRVTGMKPISNFYPPNILPQEINSEHRERVRALIVDSSNPLLTGANSTAYRAAFKKLDLLVVIDVANTETATMADYILPASSQYEKWEASFFTLEFPDNYFHLRPPLVKSKSNTLDEPEIYRRLAVEMGNLPKRFPILEKIARFHNRFPYLGLLPLSLQLLFIKQPQLKKQVLLILYATLGKTLPEGAENAAMLWGASLLYAKKYPEAVRRAGIKGRGKMLGENLFKKILKSKSGMKISSHYYDEMWELVENPGGKVNLAIPELLSSVKPLITHKQSHVGEKYPFILAAGERRSYNANQIYRDPRWRKKDHDGVMKIHPEDAERYNIDNETRVLCISNQGSIEVIAKKDENMQIGYLSLPHGYGFEYVANNKIEKNGPEINMLTSTEHCDPISKTPFHKYVPVRLELVAGN